MSYLKRYIKSIGRALVIFGLIQLGCNVIEGDPISVYFVYLSLLVGLAGPLGLWITKLENA